MHGLFADVSLRSAMSPGRIRTIDNRHVGEINALVMDFALLASLFAAISSAARSELIAQAPLFAILGAVKANGFGCLEVDHKLELGRLFDGEVDGVCTFQNLVHIAGGTPDLVWEFAP